jgi:molecular chaperone GrpE (heat shock protein)
MTLTPSTLRAVTLTPAALRLDLKCGKGAISPGEKCTKGAAQRVNPAQKTYKLSANERAIYTNAFSQGKSAHLKEGINRHKSTTDPVQAAINKLRKRELRNRRIKTVASVALTAGLIASVIDNSRRATPWATGFAP